MKIKTSITLSEDILRQVDQIIEGSGNRSKFIEQAVRSYIHQSIREQRRKADMMILNQNAATLNREAKDVLSFQVEI